jgi:hypothetical protein
MADKKHSFKPPKTPIISLSQDSKPPDEKLRREERRFQKAFGWMDATEYSADAHIDLSWAILFKSDGAPLKHPVFWVQLLNRIKPPNPPLPLKNPYDAFRGLKDVLIAIEWLIEDLSKPPSPFSSSPFPEELREDLKNIKSFFRRQPLEAFESIESDDFYGFLKKNPSYTLLMLADGSETLFVRHLLYPVAWLTALVASPADSGKLYGINKQFRILLHEGDIDLQRLELDTSRSTLHQMLQLIFEPKEEDQSSNELVSLLNNKKLRTVLSLIKGWHSSWNDRPRLRRGKPHGVTVIGRSNQISLIKDRGKSIPQEVITEELGSIQLEGFGNKSLFKLKGPSLKAIELADFELTTMASLPAEHITREVSSDESQTGNPLLELDPPKRKLNARFIADSTIRSNQHLLTNLSIMDDYTLEVLLAEIDKWSEETLSEPLNRESPPPLIISTVLAAALIFGIPVKEVIYKRRRNSLESPHEGFFISEKADAVSKGFWLCSTPLAEYVSNIHTFADTEDVSQTYRLLMPLWLTEKIQSVEELKKRYMEAGLLSSSHQKTVKQLGFVWTDSDFKIALKSFFKHLRKKHPWMEINQNLVESYLLNASLQRYDVVFSAYFTSKRTRYSHTQLFYTRLPEKLIQKRFTEFWNSKFVAMEHASQNLEKCECWPSTEEGNDQNGVTQNKAERFIGSALVPKKEVVAKIVADFTNSLSSPPSNEFEEILSYHKDYTLYTMMFLSYATGYRGVHALLPSWRLISHDQKWLAISDKDDEDASHTRITYLSPLIRKQLQHYLAHLTNFINQILSKDAVLYSKLIDSLRDWKVNLRYRTSDKRFVFDNEGANCFFSVNAKMKVSLLSLNAFFDHLYTHRKAELPANGGRHLLRTEALKNDIPSDVLNAFLGHFIYGKEPHSAFSALATYEIEHAMEDFLERHLSSLGFTPLKSQLS